MKLTDRITIVDYDPAWPATYRAEAARLRLLAEGALTDIEHFGSTAVPGLRAKPVIDIMGAVADLRGIDGFVSHLCGDDYAEMSEDFSFRRFFWKAAAAGTPSFHLHLVEAGAWQYKSERLCRDWLISHPDVARNYEALKDALASRFADDREAYTEAKSAFICATVNEARSGIGLPPLTDWQE